MPLLQKYKFEAIQEYENKVTFQSRIIKINIAFNKRENSFFMEIGNKNEILYPLNDKVIKDFFDINLKLDYVPIETFVQNISYIFEQPKGLEILNGNINNLASFICQESTKYTSDMKQDILIEKANSAWKKKDYRNYINIIDSMKISHTFLPSTLLLKYKIAKAKLAPKIKDKSDFT